MSTDRNVYRDFDLGRITWGYRDIFCKVIDQLYADNLLGQDDEVTTAFFEMLSQPGENSCFDHVLKNFLESLNPGNNWIMRIPSLFCDWTALGAELAAHKTYMGLKYFELWGENGFGTDPDEVAYVIRKTRFLMGIDMEFAYYFMVGYRKVAATLDRHGVDVFIEYALKLYRRSPKNSFSFLQLKTRTSRFYLKSIAREVRLVDIKTRLETFLSSVSATAMTVDGLGNLDSDDLIESGSTVVNLGKWLYLPTKIDIFQEYEDNFDYYLVVAVFCAAGQILQSFNSVHGSDGMRSFSEFAGQYWTEGKEPFVNTCICAEFYRVMVGAFRMFPGARQNMKKIISAELEHRHYPGAVEKVIIAILQYFCCDPKNDETSFFLSKLFGDKKTAAAATVLSLLKEVVENSENYRQTLNIIRKSAAKSEVAAILRIQFTGKIHPLSFFPDFQFPGSVDVMPESGSVLDLKQPDHDNSREDKEQISSRQDRRDYRKPQPSDNLDMTEPKKENPKNASPRPSVGYFYDEWNELDRDYYENWCCLNEKKPVVLTDARDAMSPELTKYSQYVKRIFERLKPEEARREKYLKEGDIINSDLLTEFISQRKARVSPRENFYEKPYIKKRDLTVALLLDLSGSTGEEIDGHQKIIDLEKDAACILGDGLAGIGDRFGLFGFTGSGREQAEFFVFKDFEQDWDHNSKRMLFSATPGSSTRMGVAIRHVGYKLSQIECRQKIVILITDGKPMDSGYDPNSRYAQYDVRRANEENYRLGIDAFCISTDDNRMEDLEIMFPFHRYVIIQSMTRLPQMLSQFYLKITR